MSKSQNEPAKPGADPAATGMRLTEGERAATNPVGDRLKVVTVSAGAAESGLAAGASRQDPYLGSTVDGRYQIEAVLGEGGMGIVYQCRHTIIGKKVAMKVLRADLARDSEVTERFLNEARAASAIGNPHIVDVSDFGQFPDRATYFVMEHLTGAPLSKLLEGKRALPLERILHIARQLCSGLSAAHDAGIVHRDLKPDNIFLIQRGAERDFVKILDFGIAKTNAATRLTRDGAVFGTPHYMSPEQAAGNPVDRRGDVYSLGVILYEMASGQVPFDAESFMGILSQHLHKAPTALSKLEPPPPDLSPGLDAIVLKCLAKQAQDRYPDMLALDADLERLEHGQEPLALLEMRERSLLSDPPAKQASRKSRQSAVLIALALLSTLGLALALLLPKSWLSEVGPRASAEAAAIAIATTAASEPSVVPSTPASAAAVASPASAADPIPAPKQVVLAVEPLDARIFRGEDELGTSPVVIELREGENATLEIRRDGYAAAAITLDGKRTREVVKLAPLPRPTAQRASEKPPARPAAKKNPPKPLGDGEIVNPWK